MIARALGHEARTELRVVARSRWTYASALVLSLLVGYALHNAYGFALMDRAILRNVSAGNLTAFRAWLESDPGALALRQDIWTAFPSMVPNVLLSALATLGPLVAVAWGAGIVGSEYHWRTNRIRAASSGPSRVFFAKLLIAILGCMLAVALVAAVGVPAGHILWAFVRQKNEMAAWVPPAPRPPLILIQWSVLAAGLSFYAVLGCSFAALTHSTAAALIGGLALPFAEQWAKLWWLPRNAFADLLSRHVVYFPGGVTSPVVVPHPAPTGALPWLVLLAWAAAIGLVAAAVVRMQKQ